MNRLSVPLLFAVLALASGIAACSSSGSPSTSAPRTVPTGGLGVPASAVTQKLTFSVNVPPCGASCTPTQSRARAPRDAAPTAGPYVSPATASLTIALVALNGASFASVQPPVSASVPCTTSAAGCVVTVAGVPAAVGNDEYLVTTYAADGTVISSSPIVVTVGANGAAPVSLGATGAVMLSVGGYVASIAIIPATLNIDGTTPTDTKFVVQASDAGHAIIVGNVQFATPIGVSVDDTSHFTLNGQTTPVLVTSPAGNQITLHAPAAANLLITKIRATSADASGPITPAIATVVVNPAVATPPPSPSPGVSASPQPTPTPRGLYILDGYNQRIAEFTVPALLESGAKVPANLAPRRVIDFNPGALTCPSIPIPVGGSGGVQDIAPDAGGNVFASINCSPSVVIYQYGANATANDAPLAVFDVSTLPLPGGTSFTATSAGYGRIMFDQANSTASAEQFVLVSGTNGPIFRIQLTPATVPVAALQPVTVIAAENYDTTTGNSVPDLPTVPGSTVAQTSFQNPSVPAAAIDANFNVYTGGAFAPALPPALAALQNYPAVIGQSTSSSAEYGTGVFTVAGDATQLGGPQPIGPWAIGVDGGSLYAAITEFQQTASGALTGLDGCAPASGAATADIAAPLCSDGLPHQTIARYNLTGILTAPSPYVSPSPAFMLGADANLAVTRIGCIGNPSGAAATNGSMSAVRGILYNLNATGPNCATATSTPPFSGEVDVYDLRARNTGNHTDIAPAAVIANPNGFFTSLATGGAGTGAGGTLGTQRHVFGRGRSAPALGAIRLRQMRARYLDALRRRTGVHP